MQSKALFAVIFILVVSGFSSSNFAQAGESPLNLNGKWLTDDGEEIKITQQSGSVTSTFTSTLPGETIAGDCPGKGSNKHRAFYINGNLAGQSLSGTMSRCTLSKPLMEDCGLDPAYTTTFQTTLVSNTLIKGTRRSEWYGPKKDPGKNDACKFVRDSSGDKDVDFTLKWLKDYINGTGKDIPRLHPFEIHPDDLVPSDDCPDDLWILTAVDIAFTDETGFFNMKDLLQPRDCSGQYQATWICPTSKAIRKTSDQKNFKVTDARCGPDAITLPRGVRDHKPVRLPF
jgi:hypothetical protein